MKIVFMGTPTFSVGILEALTKKYEVLLVVSQPDKEMNRKKELLPTPVKQKAIELGIEVFQPTKIKTDHQKILDVKADVLITAAYGQIIPESLLNTFKKCINVHASLLPKYRGGAPIQRSIINGDSVTGVSIMQMVKKMDAGDVYATKQIKILDSDNSDILFEKLSVIGKDLLLESLEDIYNEKILGVKQKEDEVTFAFNLTKEEEKINFNKSSKEVFNQIRGLSSNPGAYSIINGNILKVYESKIIDDESNFEPGTIIDLKKRMIVKTIDGAIELLSIKPQGKKIMNTKDFLNGQKLFKEFDVFE